MRLGHGLALLIAVAAVGPSARAEYVALRNGQRLNVTGYELIGDKYRLQMNGGTVEVRAEDVVAIEPEEAFAAIPQPKADPAADPNAPFHEMIQDAAARYKMDVDLITSVIAAESNFDPKAVSRRNARGLMQLMPQTAVKLGVQNVFDPRQNIDGGTRYLRDLLQRYNNNLVLALAAYNAGPERVQRYGNVPPYSETISYVRRVKRTYEQRKREAAAKPPSAPASSTPAATQSASQAGRL